MINSIFKLEEGAWSAAQLSRLALILAFCIPILTVAVGTAIGTDLERLSSAMIAFWAFAAISLGLAIIVARNAAGAERTEHRRWLTVVCVILAVGPAVKAGPAAYYYTRGIPVVAEEPRTQTRQGNGCRPELVSSDTKPLSEPKDGSSGNIAWLFWIGNYYSWHLEVSIAANSSGADGTAAALGWVSHWYSLRAEKRAAVAKARGNIDCVPEENGCTCFAQSTRQTRPDGDFTARVVVSRIMTTGGADLEVATTATVAGEPGPEINLGTEKAGIKFSAPNTALDSIDDSKSYSYRCSHAGP